MINTYLGFTALVVPVEFVLELIDRLSYSDISDLGQVLTPEAD